MKNFVFDLYGTLVDIKTDEDAPKFIAAMQRYFGREDFWEQYKSLCAQSDTGDKFCEIDLSKVFEKFSAEPLKAAQIFRRKSLKKLKVYRGARKLLKELKKRGAKVYLLTNAQACFTVPELKKLKLESLFDGIEISSRFGEKKPSPAFFAHIIEKYNLEPSETVYIGNDLSCDILGAKGAGFNTAYIKSNISPEEDDLNTARKIADFATDSFKELTGYLLQ